MTAAGQPARHPRRGRREQREPLSVYDGQSFSNPVPPRKLIVAHAGGKSVAHPNTVEAFAHAIRVGADMIEFDVRRTADHQLVVHHDDTLGEFALATTPLDRLQAEALARGYHIPRLTEVLALARGRVMLDVELKESGYEDAVLRALHDHG